LCHNINSGTGSHTYTKVLPKQSPKNSLKSHSLDDPDEGLPSPTYLLKQFPNFNNKYSVSIGQKLQRAMVRNI